MKPIIILLCCLLILTPFVYGEDYENEKIFELLDRSAGLNNLSVSGIVQDKYGFLWFASQGGLNRYDGTTFTTFRSDPFDDNTLINNLIQSIYYEEEEHVLWLGTYQGVSQFDIDEEMFTHYTVDSHSLSNPVVTSIIKRNNKIWIGSLGGLDCLDLETDEIVSFDIPGNVVRDLVFDKEGILYIGTYEGLFTYDGDIKKYDIELPSSYVMVMNYSEENILTLGMWDGGLLELNLNDGSTEIYSFDDNRVYSLMIDHLGSKWVGTWGGGLFVIENHQVLSYPGQGGNRDISHGIVYSIFEDDSNIVWIGTNGGGINKWNPRKTSYKIYSPDDSMDSISDGKVNAIHFYEDKLYVGMYSNGLNVLDFTTDKFEKFTSENSNLHIDSINDIITYKDKLLIATANGLTLFDGQKFEVWDIIPDSYIVYSLEEKDDVLYIGTYNQGLYIYDGTLKHLNTSNSDLSNDLIYDIHIDEEGLIWIGTNEGLNVLDNDYKISVYKKGDTKNHLSSNKIQSIFEDSSHDLWFGTAGGGILHFDRLEEVFEAYTERNGLSSNDVLNILEDDDGYLWISTSDGISRLNAETGEIYSYTPLDGIGGWEFSRGSTHVGNKLFFGGTHGITVIPTHIENKEVVAPRVYITQIETTRTSDTSLKILNGDTINIEPSESYLVFDVTTIEYDNSDKMMVSYQLLGHNEDWIHLGSNKRIAYSNLPPGQYVLQVQVTDANNIKSEVVSVSLNVEYPWYLNPFMFIVYVLGFIALVYIIIRAREAKTFKMKNDKLFALNQQLEDLAITDPLTGVYNRRYLKKTLTDHLDLARRSNTYISLLMIDIDDFKEINDQYGHLQGDQLLILLAERLDSVIQRKTDFVARYGGDEFAVVLYDTNIEGTEAMANKIHDLFNRTLTTDKHEVELNISMGLTCKIPEVEDSLDTLMKAADDCLYEAKALGKNQIQS